MRLGEGSDLALQGEVVEARACEEGEVVGVFEEVAWSAAPRWSGLSEAVDLGVIMLPDGHQAVGEGGGLGRALGLSHRAMGVQGDGGEEEESEEGSFHETGADGVGMRVYRMPRRSRAWVYLAALSRCRA